MFSCDDYDKLFKFVFFVFLCVCYQFLVNKRFIYKLYALVDWRLVFFHFMSTAFIVCCSSKNLLCIAILTKILLSFIAIRIIVIITVIITTTIIIR